MAAERLPYSAYNRLPGDICTCRRRFKFAFWAPWRHLRGNTDTLSTLSAFPGETTAAVDEPSHEVVIYEETYPYNPAEYLEPGTSSQDYYPQHYNYQYQPQETRVDRNDNRRVFLGGLGVSVLVSDAERKAFAINFSWTNASGTQWNRLNMDRMQ